MKRFIRNIAWGAGMYLLLGVLGLAALGGIAIAGLVIVYTWVRLRVKL